MKFFSGGPFTGGTDLLVWRDPKVVQGAFDCPVVRGRPVWYPQAQEATVIFDEQEHPERPEACAFAQPSQCPPLPPFAPFPAATQRVHIGGDQFPVPFAFGWLYLDLNLRSTVSPFVPPVDPAAAQAWVVSTVTATGHFAVTTDAFRLDSACTPIHFVPHL